MVLFSNKEKRLRDAFNAVHLEFEEHLDSINTNTQEILENRHMLLELEERITHIAANIAEIKSELQTVDTSPAYEKIDLTIREQEVFLLLYMHESGRSYERLSEELSLPISLVRDLIYDLISKGVPIIKQRTNNQLVVSLDLEFREYQSRFNVVGIDQGVSKQLSKDFQRTLIE